MNKELKNGTMYQDQTNPNVPNNVLSRLDGLEHEGRGLAGGGQGEENYVRWHQR